MIKNVEELRVAATLITADVNTICNTSDIEEATQKFIEVKELLIDIFKFNVDRLQK